MSFFETILLGIIQGITEFFPISSSGHLIIVEQLFGVETEYGVFFNVVLHIGTLAAVLIAFRKEVIRLFWAYICICSDIWKNSRIFLGNLFKNQDFAYRKILRTQYRKLAIYVLLSSIPTALIGLLLRRFVSNGANSLFVVGFGLLVTGLLLFVAGFHQDGKKTPKDVSFLSAIVIGICQGCSVIPGISRFGTTMTSGLLSGYNKRFAFKYSFLVSIPAILGAMILELSMISESSSMTFGFVICCVTGAIVATLSSLLAIKVLMWIIKKNKLRIFTYYCFILGVFVIVLNYLV